MAPAPRQLPELRGSLATWLQNIGPGFYFTMSLEGRQRILPGMTATRSAAHIAANELSRVKGDLYWVSAPMTDLTRHAAPQLPTRNLYPHDVPSHCGLMVFEAPLATYRNDAGRDVEIVAASWGPWNGPAGIWDHGGLWLSFYSHPAAMFPAHAFTASTRLAPEWESLAAAAIPPILPDNEAGWPFGKLDGDPPVPGSTTADWALIVRAAWRLMRQPLARQDTQQPDRHARRRLARVGLPASGVRVIHIRRPEHRAAGQADSMGIPGSRDYNCQWWVGGHWRTYWCGPGRTRPEDRWISPYLAGPDGKPIRGTERVRVWDR